MKIIENKGKFSIIDFDELEAYVIACKIERDGIEFYKKLIQTSVAADAKEALEFLLLEEERHLKIFENSIGVLQEMKELPEDNDLLRSMDFGIFEPYAHMDDLDDILRDIKKSLSLGIVIENKSIVLYEACMARIEHQEAKQELKYIIEEEKKHKVLLESLLRRN